MKKIAVICAFYDEIIYFIDKYNINKDLDINLVTMGDNEIYIANSGVGKVNASMMCQKLIDKYDVDYIINSGCSGAIDSSINLYDIVVANEIFYHDFMPAHIMQKYVPNNGILRPDEFLLEKIKFIGKRENISNNIIFGKIATGDCYITEDSQREILAINKATCVDMESAAIAHVASKNNVPFVCIRSISDFANGNEADEIESSRIAAQMTELLINEIID